MAIGIKVEENGYRGTPIAERPSHTTGHTDHVSGDSAGQNRHKRKCGTSINK